MPGTSLRAKRSKLVALLGMALFTGCSLIGPDCINENRSLTLEETFGGGFRAIVVLDEMRDADTDDVTSRRISWAVEGDLDGDVVTGVHLHQGQGGPVLASLPIQNARQGIFTSGEVLEPQFLSLPYDEFYDLLQTQPVHVDLHSTGSPGGTTLGRLVVRFDNPWFHPYCS